MALRTCAQRGCPALVTSGRCQAHARQVDRQRGTARERGYGTAWDAYSVQFRRQHPICGERHDGTLDATHSRCLQSGRLTLAQCVDHIEPVSRGGVLMDPTNHQSLCVACHGYKTTTEDGGFGHGRR